MDIQSVRRATQAPPALAERPAGQAPQVAPVNSDPPPSTSEQQKAKPVPSHEQMEQALKSINSVLQLRSQDLEFSVDSESHRTIVRVVDKKTKELIRQMPSQEALDIAKALDRLQSLLIRETA